jgi:uroporphyrinogen decarboxylase
MNSRERVMMAMRRTGVPDRVPLQFDLCRSLLEDFGRKYNMPVQYSASYYEDLTYRISANDLRTRMGSDCVLVGAGLPSGYSYPVTEEGYIINEFGMTMRQGALYMETVKEPLDAVSSVDEVMAFPFPDPLAAGRYDDVVRQIEQYGQEYFIIGDLELTIFEMAWHMVGLEKFMLDMAMGEAYVGALLDRVKEFSIGVGKRLIELGVDMIWTGDDVGSQTNMLISPTMWRNIFKPRMAEIFEEFKQVNPDILIAYHSDGSVAPILGELIEIGVDVFNPVQPNVPGNEPVDLKSQFGGSVAFWGAIDQQHVLPFTDPATIDAHVAERIEILGEGGGYMCAPAHIIQADTSMENVEAFIEAVKKHGVYD